MAKSRIAAILTDRRLLLGTPGRVVLLLLLVNVLVAWRRGELERERRANLLLETVEQSAAAGPAPRYDVSVGERLAKYLPAIPDARTQRLALLVGMSQMYAINEKQPGDLTISELLDDKTKPSGTRVFGLAAPNLNNEEALFLLLTTTAKPATTPDVFIYGVCFDKMRGVDLRQSYLRFVRDHPESASDLLNVAARYETKYPLAASKIRATITAASQFGTSAQEDLSFEDRLRQNVADVVPVVGARRELNQFVMYEVLYKGRNKLLGITPTSKRPIIPGRYELNKQFLLLMIEEAKRRDLRFAMYVVPLNPQAENPYIPDEYSTFKQWLAATAAQTSVSFANLENAVPHEDWGLFLGGPDFKHFKGMGHRRTADAIAGRFGPLLTGGKSASGRGTQQ